MARRSILMLDLVELFTHWHAGRSAVRRSPWAAVLPFVEIVRALRPGSPVLRRVAAAPLPDDVRWLSVTAALDIIVPGLRAVPSHAQVQTITFDGVGHLGMLLSRQVIGCIAAALCPPQMATAAKAPIHLLPNAS